jgi:hypothetical protein
MISDMAKSSRAVPAIKITILIFRLGVSKSIFLKLKRADG